MPLQQVYRKTDDTVIGNFSSSEIATGKSIKTMNLADFDTTPSYQLLEGVVYSNNLRTDVVGNNAVLDLDFDLDLERPITVEGDGSVTMTGFGSNGGAGTPDIVTTMVASVIKVDASSNESILDTASLKFSGSAITTATSMGRKTSAFTLPRTLIRKGEKLRLNLSGAVATSGTGTFGVYHDPKNRDDSVTGISLDGSEAFALIPFNIST